MSDGQQQQPQQRTRSGRTVVRTLQFWKGEAVQRAHADFGIISASLGYLPQKYTKGLAEHLPPSLFAYLEETQGLRISRALTELFIPDKADPLRVLLQLPEGCDAFGFRQYHYDSRGNPLLYSLDYLRSDLFHFTILRNRP